MDIKATRIFYTLNITSTNTKVDSTLFFDNIFT